MAGPNTMRDDDRNMDTQNNTEWNQLVKKVEQEYGEDARAQIMRFQGNTRDAITWLQQQYPDAEEKFSEFTGDEGGSSEEERMAA